MGMYTELNVGVRLRRDTPDVVINTLKFMLGEGDEIKTPDHPLFETDRWRIMLRCGSYYFDGRPDSSIERDIYDREYGLNVRCNLKNYCNEIALFMDFIRPYLTTNGFLGYTIYEECDVPTLIYNDYGNIEFKKIEVM